MKIFGASILLPMLLLVCTSSVAQTIGSQEGKVETIQTGFNTGEPYALVTFGPLPELEVICASAGEARMLFNPSTEEGKVMLSLLLTAKVSSVNVEYRSYDCASMPNGSKFESLSWIRF